MIYKYEISDMKICDVRNFFSNWGYTYKYEMQEWMGDKDIIPDSVPNTPERKFLMGIPQDMVLWNLYVQHVGNEDIFIIFGS